MLPYPACGTHLGKSLTSQPTAYPPSVIIAVDPYPNILPPPSNA